MKNGSILTPLVYIGAEINYNLLIKAALLSSQKITKIHEKQIYFFYFCAMAYSIALFLLGPFNDIKLKLTSVIEFNFFYLCFKQFPQSRNFSFFSLADGSL